MADEAILQMGTIFLSTYIHIHTYFQKLLCALRHFVFQRNEFVGIFIMGIRSGVDKCKSYLAYKINSLTYKRVYGSV